MSGHEDVWVIRYPKDPLPNPTLTHKADGTFVVKTYDQRICETFRTLAEARLHQDALRK
jgi:hypothetical protein